MKPGNEYECVEKMMAFYFKLINEVSYGYGNPWGTSGNIISFCLKWAVKYDSLGEPRYRRNRY